VKRERFDAVVHFVVVVLNMLSISSFLIFWLAGGADNRDLEVLAMISCLSWLVLLALTLFLVVTSHPHRRIALFGMLFTFGLILLATL
jgi:hypothetical protein